MVHRSGRADWDWILQVTFMCRGGGAGQQKGHGDGSWENSVVLGGEAWEGECSAGNEVKTLVNGFSPWGFVLLSAVGDTGAPAPSLWSPAPGTVCPHTPSLVTTQVLVISRCPLLARGRRSQLSLGMLSPKSAAALLWGSALSLLLWLTETRPLTFVWTLSTSNQLVLVFDISWESHQEALVVLFSFLLLKFPSFSQPCSPLSAWSVWFCVPQQGPTQCQAAGTSLMCLTLGSLNLAAFLSNWRKKLWNRLFFPSQMHFHA